MISGYNLSVVHLRKKDCFKYESFFFIIINDTNIPIWFVTLHIKANRKFYSTKILHALVKEFF